MIQISLELLAADLDEQLLADSVTLHEPLDVGRMHVLILPDDIHDVMCVARAPPRVLNPGSSLNTVFL